MNIRHLTAAVLAASVALPTQVWAKDDKPVPFKAIEEKNLKSGKDKFDPSFGYIFNSGSFRFSGMFLKVPSADDVAEYEAEWNKALEKAKGKYAKRLASYEQDLALAKQTKSNLPEKPIEPTAENFSIGDIETRTKLVIGPQFVFSKDNGYSYLSRVQPGTYIYYGPIALNPNGGFIGSCYCMGTVQFEVKAGKITNLGPVLSRLSPEAGPFVMQDANFTLPASLQEFPNENADLRASGKLDNFFGVLVDRLAPIDGILSYERDKVVDLKAVATAPQVETLPVPPVPVEEEIDTPATEG